MVAFAAAGTIENGEVAEGRTGGSGAGGVFIGEARPEALRERFAMRR